ncbi:hypothetical protein BV22DRAFT_1050128 [Leucogyrophana mollusca]|uniref:Uncharacterized protein n=1 Tax=Leucogyrophana mollusca TaxID=85980 RepID=A0ACB8B4Z5_9AGAM|nr:hypothetical protein BV22DRAFT_1050128 [Leucogyrophana mollusca]
MPPFMRTDNLNNASIRPQSLDDFNAIRHKLPPTQLDISQPSSVSISTRTFDLAYATVQACQALEIATRYKLQQQKLYVTMLEEEFADAKLKSEEAQGILVQLSPPSSTPAMA